MNNSRALAKKTASEQQDAGTPTIGPALQVSKSVLHFDQTDPGEESFLTLKITPPHPNTLIVVSVQDMNLFQVAVGIERLAFKQVLTFKPEAAGSYIHLRYTPERTGRHQSVLTVEAPATAETVRIPLVGRTGGMIGLPLPTINRLPAGEYPVRRPARSLVTSLLVGGLLLGIGYVGYTYKCQIWPSTCGPALTTSSSVRTDQPATRTSEPVQPAATRLLDEEREKPVDIQSTATDAQPTRRLSDANSLRDNQADAPDEAIVKPKPSGDLVTPRAKTQDEPTVAASERDLPAQSKPVTEKAERKSTAKAKAVASSRKDQPVSPKSVAKPKQSEESELEQVLNHSSN